MSRPPFPATLGTVKPSALTNADEATALAMAEATAAAAASRVVVRELSDPAEHRAVERLFAEVWSTEPDHPPLSGDTMRMLAYTGGYVAAAYDGDELLGGVVGFLTDDTAATGPAHLHSHITGVVSRAEGRHIGYALKLHQRAWALRRGIGRVTWTFDPLVCRNAYFNLVKLGAHATRYLEDFYGDMTDGRNVGQGSDRLLIDWSLNDPIPAPDRSADVTSLVKAERVLLRPDDDGIPRHSEADGADWLVCAIPADIERLRRFNPQLALDWRRAIRTALGGALADSHHIAGFTRSGYYLLESGGLR